MTETLLVQGGALIDGTGAGRREATSILIEGDRITAVGADADRAATAGPSGPGGPSAVKVIDATGRTVMPGLVDAHCHTTFGEPASNDELFFHRQPAYAAMVAAWNAPKILRAGVTSALDPDSIFEIGPQLRDAIEAGMVEGPRLRTGLYALLTTVGGTAGRLIPDQGTLGYAEVVRTDAEIVEAVRRHVKYGADWIKVHATGLIPGRAGEVQVWSRHELQVVCDAAHELGIPVMTHCRNASSTRDSARAGVDLLLHATFMDDEALDAVIEAQVPICPTMTFLANLVEWGDKVGAMPHVQDIFRDELALSAPAYRAAHAAGVPLLCGSESGFSITPYGHWHARELELFVRDLGLTPLEAITCATANGAIAMRDDSIGTIVVGQTADLLVVDGDPLVDLSVLGDRRRLHAVVKGGRVVDLDRPWPDRRVFAGETVGLYGDRALTREVVYP